MVCLLFAIAQFLAAENLAKNFIPLKTINFQGMILFNEFLVFQEVYCHKPLTEYISFLSPSPGDEERSETFSTKGFQQRQWWCRRSSMSRGRSHWLTLTTCLGPSDLASPATEALLHLVTRPSTVYLETDWCSVDKMRRYKRVKNKSSTCTNVEPGKVPLGISEKCTTKCMIIKTW